MSGVFAMMKRLIPVIAIILGWAAAAWATAPAAPVTLTTLSAIHALSNAEAAKQLPVAFEATVTYYRWYDQTLFVEDGGEAISIKPPLDTRLIPGDRILVKGITKGSFRPLLIASSVTLLHHGGMPKPVPSGFGDMISGRRDCIFVSVHAVVRTADMINPVLRTAGRVLSPTNHIHIARMRLLTEGGQIDAEVDTSEENALKDLLDADVEVTGTAAGEFDDKMQQTGVLLYIDSLANVKVLKHAVSNPWSPAITSMDLILSGYHLKDFSQRIHVRGTITYYQPGSALVLESGSQSLWIATQAEVPLRIGDVADATGFPHVRDGFMSLTDAEIQVTHLQSPVTPYPVTWRQLALSGYIPDGHLYDLVSIEGQVVTEVRGAAQDEYVLTADGQLFSAIYRHPRGAGNFHLTPMKQIPVGSRARFTGICLPNSSDPLIGPVAFDLLLRSFDDIVVVARPSLLNMRNLMFLVGLLLLLVFVVLIRGWTVERKVRHQTAALASLELRRSRILEDINGSRPLNEILEKIAEMVSSALEGAPCWCEIADGAKLGKYSEELQSLRIVREPIPARTGPALGALYAGLDPWTPPLAHETVALQNGVRLAALAIETRRLYSDLRRRSEFDLLTDIHNRFAMEKFMELQIEEARQSDLILGLIYIDLDKFKPINDTYGHHVGDLYLQEVAKRMSRQLLGSDMLARLGGDEFAALVSLHHGRADLDRIVARLEHCFDDPFVVGGYLLNGEASIGFALYPEDGASKDSLLSAADAAMYAVKNKKKNLAKSTEPILPSEL